METGINQDPLIKRPIEQLNLSTLITDTAALKDHQKLKALSQAFSVFTNKTFVIPEEFVKEQNERWLDPTINYDSRKGMDYEFLEWHFLKEGLVDKKDTTFETDGKLAKYWPDYNVDWRRFDNKVIASKWFEISPQMIHAIEKKVVTHFNFIKSDEDGDEILKGNDEVTYKHIGCATAKLTLEMAGDSQFKPGYKVVDVYLLCAKTML